MDELRSDDPRWIGAYRLMGRLGVGGMGRVYLARSPRGRTVAVKLVRAELAEQDEFRTRFRREVRAARRVGGAWTAPVLDADTEADVPWVATGYVAGPSLQQVVAQDHGPLPAASMRVLAAGLAHALTDIHAAGLVHRDLKPSNVMITIDGPRVIDFGIARALETVAEDGSVTYTGAMVGSPAFMSPEQVRGDRVTPACDVFCLGSVLAYAATGLQPFGAAGSGVHAQMFRIVQEQPDLAAVPPELRGLVAACLAKEPERRPTPAEVRELLAAAEPERDPGPAGAVAAEPGAAASGGEPWLPAAIVARLGRHAVRLLELEAAETGSMPAVTLPAPVRQPPPAEPPADAGAPAEPPAAAEAAPANVTAYQAGYAHGLGDGRGDGRGHDDGDGNGHGNEHGDGHGPGERSGYGPRTAPAGAAEPAEPADPAPRRRARGTLLTVVAVLAVIASGTTAFVVLRGGGHRDGTAGQAAAPTASAAGAKPGATPADAGSHDGAGAGTGTVPADLVGTWRAAFDSSSTAGGTPGVNTRTLTVRPDGAVELTGDGPAYDCAWSMRVTSAGPPVALSPSAVTRGEPATSCLPGDATTLTLLDPTHLRRDNAEPGKAPLTYRKTG